MGTALLGHVTPPKTSSTLEPGLQQVKHVQYLHALRTDTDEMTVKKSLEKDLWKKLM